jgi:hypothetical protein
MFNGINSSVVRYFYNDVIDADVNKVENKSWKYEQTAL